MSEIENIIERLKSLGILDCKNLGQVLVENNSVCTQTRESFSGYKSDEICLKLDKR